jgi:hypothetical protein
VLRGGATPAQLRRRYWLTDHWRGFFWRVLDELDYWIIQARLWVVDAVCGPEPEPAARRRSELTIITVFSVRRSARQSLKGL